MFMKFAILLFILGVQMSKPQAASQMVGAPVQQDVNIEENIKLAQEVVAEYNKNHPEDQRILVKIISMTSQVVAGIRYEFELETAPESGNGPTSVLKASVLSQPWISEKNQISIL